MSEFSTVSNGIFKVIPGLVIFFSGLIFITGNLSRGQKPISHRLSIVQVWESDRRARVDGIMGIYSPYRSIFSVRANEGTVLFPVPIESIGLSNAPEITQDADQFTMSGMRVDVGGVFPLAYQSTIDSPKLSNDLKLVINENGTRLQGSIKNESDLSLDNAVLLTSTSTIVIGNFRSGEIFTANQLLDTAQASQLNQNPGNLMPAPVFSSPVQIYSPGNTIEQILGTYDYYQNRELYRKYSLLTAAMGYSPASIQQSNEVFLLGWSNASFLDIDITKVDEIHDDVTLFIFALNPEVTFEGTQWSLTPGFFNWSTIDTSRTDISPYNLHLYSASNYGLSFSPRQNVLFSEVESLTFHLVSPYQNGSIQSAIFSLWNYDRQEWQQIDKLVWGDNQIDSPSQFVPQEYGSDELGSYSPGTIRLYVETNTDYMEITSTDFTLVLKR